MKKVLFRIFNLFMAVVVLTTATGFGLVEHSCLMRGKTVFIYKKSNDSTVCEACQTKNLTEQQTFKKSKCCTESSSFQNIDYSSSIVQYTVKFVKMAFQAVLNAFVHLLEMVTAAIISVFTHLFTSSATSLSGRSLLIFIQIFQI